MMECQTSMKDDCSKKSENSNISGNSGHKDMTLDRKSLAPGQILWAKGFQCSWWPAQVVDERDISENIIVNERVEGGVLVRFYGSYSYAWVDPFVDVSKFREFKSKGCNHIKAFQKALEEIMLYNKLNKPSVQVDGVYDDSATPSQRNKSGEKPTVEELEETQSQGNPKEKALETANIEESEKIRSQWKQNEKVVKRAKLEEPEIIQSQRKRKEKKPKNAKVEEQEQIQNLGKRKEKSPDSAKIEEPEQVQCQGKKKKATKSAKAHEPEQIQSQGKGKEKAPKRARGEEPEKIQSQGKRGKKTPKCARGEEPVQTQSQGRVKEKSPNSVKGEESEQTQSQGKKKEKGPFNVTQRSQGKRKEKDSPDAQEIMEHGSEKMVRQIRVMRQLGLAAPAGSPFGVDLSIKTAP